MRTMLSSIVDSAVEHAERVKGTVERGRERWREGRGEVVIRDRSTKGRRTVRLCSPAEGRCKAREVEWHSYVVALRSQAVRNVSSSPSLFARLWQHDADRPRPHSRPTGSVHRPSRLVRRRGPTAGPRPRGRDDRGLVRRRGRSAASRACRDESYLLRGSVLLNQVLFVSSSN